MMAEEPERPAGEEQRLVPEDLRPGAVVCEVSLPHDVSRRVAVERPGKLGRSRSVS